MSDRRPSKAAGPRWATLLFWALLAVIVFSTLCPIELRPKTGHVLGERFAAYLLLGLAAALARPRTPLRDFLRVAVIAALLEAAQLVVPAATATSPMRCRK